MLLADNLIALSYALVKFDRTCRVAEFHACSETVTKKITWVSLTVPFFSLVYRSIDRAMVEKSDQITKLEEEIERDLKRAYDLEERLKVSS